VVIKATKFDGVYDKDPAESDDARKLPHVSYQEALANDAVKVMDKAAVGLAMEQGLPIIVFDAMQAGSFKRLVGGEAIGTVISQ
jgi:uridylate kinase